MKSQELQELTASEPLSLEEEYEMQKKWQIDQDKLTFIVLFNANTRDDSSQLVPEILDWPLDSAPLPSFADCQMIGDVNIFLKGTPQHLRTASSDEDQESFEAEAEIMIAEPEYRRKGCAIEALRLLLEYTTREHQFTNTLSAPSTESSDPLPVRPETLVIRVSESNEPSIRLFGKLGFQVTKRVEVFQEIEMRWRRPASPN